MLSNNPGGPTPYSMEIIGNGLTDEQKETLKNLNALVEARANEIYRGANEIGTTWAEATERGLIEVLKENGLDQFVVLYRYDKATESWVPLV